MQVNLDLDDWPDTVAHVPDALRHYYHAFVCSTAEAVLVRRHTSPAYDLRLAMLLLRFSFCSRLCHLECKRMHKDAFVSLLFSFFQDREALVKENDVLLHQNEAFERENLSLAKTVEQHRKGEREWEKQVSICARPKLGSNIIFIKHVILPSLLLFNNFIIKL